MGIHWGSIGILGLCSCFADDVGNLGFALSDDLGAWALGKFGLAVVRVELRPQLLLSSNIWGVPES